MSALIGPTKPAAGVIATSPTTIAVAAPTAVGLRDRATSRSIQTTSVAAGDNIVGVDASAGNPTPSVAAAPESETVNASPATPFAATALPAFKPNQPNHNRPAPNSVNGM